MLPPVKRQEALGDLSGSLQLCALRGQTLGAEGSDEEIESAF